MPRERAGLIRVGGREATVIGDDLQVGDPGPEWEVGNALDSTRGLVRIIAALPSLDTPVCDRETRTFNQRAAELGPDLRILVVSTDPPYAQNRWCGAAGIDQVVTLSDHLTGEFRIRYGRLIKERRILRRATFVVDRKDRVAYASYLPKLGDEPDFNEIFEAARRAL